MAKRKRRTPDFENKLRLYTTKPDALEDALATGKDAQWFETYWRGDLSGTHTAGPASQTAQKTGWPARLDSSRNYGIHHRATGHSLDDVIWFDPKDIALGKLALAGPDVASEPLPIPRVTDCLYRSEAETHERWI